MMSHDVFSEMCSASTPFLMLTDIFDMMVLNDCQEMFDVIEDRVLTWKSVCDYTC